MKDGDFVNLEFTGRVKDTKEIFDTTNEEVAKTAGVHDAKAVYGPVPIIVGANQTLPGLEEAVKEMNVGEKKTIDIPPEKAFGQKNSDLVKLVPMSYFKESDLDPQPGRVVNLNGVRGRILSVDGGRVKLDFNHPLAGKTLEYDLEIKDEIKEVDQKIKATVRYFTGSKIEDSSVVISGKEASIQTKLDLPKQAKQSIADTIMKWVDGISKVIFSEVFEKEK